MVIKHLGNQSLKLYRHAKRLTILVIGITIIGIGVAMIVLPGPAIVVIPLGLLILATEFVWAQHVLNKIKERIGVKR